MDNVITVTFDTNAFRPLVEPHKRLNEDVTAYDHIELAIKSGRIRPFLSDAIVVLEGIPRNQRAEFYRNSEPSILSRTESRKIDDAGEIATIINIKIGPRQPFPALPDPLLRALRKGHELGFRYIHTPRIAQKMIEPELYKNETDSALSARLERTFEALEAFEDRGFGAGHIHDLSDEAIANQPELERKGRMRAAAFGGRDRAFGEAVGEWSDADLVAAHYGYGHDYLCTYDLGKGAGRSSILHSEHREWLESTFEIRIRTPQELAALL